MPSMMITTAGLAALVNAQGGGTDPIVISQLGLSAQAVTLAPTITTLGGEFKRLNTVSGQAVAANIIHLNAQDSSTDSYDLRSVALYLDDGTLFAVFGQATPIYQKVSIGTFLVNFDIAFTEATGASISFGASSFLYPPASESVAGVARLATQAQAAAGTNADTIITPARLAEALAAASVGQATEAALGTARLATQGQVSAGTDNLRIVTPLRLAQRLTPLADAIANESAARISAINAEATARTNADTALAARTIGGAGLASASGTAANRIITVPAASGAEVAAGTANDRAVTPAALSQFPQVWNSVRGLGGSIIKTGTIVVSLPFGGSHTFPVAFPQACDKVFISPRSNMDEGDESDEGVWVSSESATGFTIGARGDGPSVTLNYLAIGH